MCRIDLSSAAPIIQGRIRSGGGGRASGGFMGGTTSAGDIVRIKGDDADEQAQLQRGNNVLHLGAKTFYRKDGAWIDADVKEDEVKKAAVVEAFSEEYFKLSRGLGAVENQYLSFKEPVVVKLAGKVYRINTAPASR
jgi:hypothetical protein